MVERARRYSNGFFRNVQRHILTTWLLICSLAMCVELDGHSVLMRSPATWPFYTPWPTWATCLPDTRKWRSFTRDMAYLPVSATKQRPWTETLRFSRATEETARSPYELHLTAVFGATATCRLPMTPPGIERFLDSPARSLVTIATELPRHLLNAQQSPSSDDDGNTAHTKPPLQTRRIIPVFTLLRHWYLSWARRIQSITLYTVLHN